MTRRRMVSMIERRLIEVEGLVQGVGFRPFVHELATRLELSGSVRNDAVGVSIDVEGEPGALDAFLRELSNTPPPLAVIERIHLEPTATAARDGFHIEPSDDARAGLRLPRIPPDVATCNDCVRELFDVADRRYRYPFSSCSQCGPRLTISRGPPYDRHTTTMDAFPMCDACRGEYEDPRNRRFHAQTIACAECGPTVTLHDPARTGDRLTSDAAVRGAAAALLGGLILAVKGLGGFHLACDATSAAVVRRLRERKRREAKPLAVMVRDLAEAQRLCEVNEEEAILLSGPQRPIVLLAKRQRNEVADAVAPGNQRLGVMLPYTPLHHLLLADTGRALVMTSGNASDEPIAYDNDDALRRLGGIADVVLLHDRTIATRCDDSVVRVVGGVPTFVRRSRGFCPSPIALAHVSAAATLGVGGHLKNTFCLTAGGSALVSHHVGDLENVAAYRALEDGIEQYEALFDVHADIVAHDEHPDYLSTQLAERLSASANLERLAVQHHHAHVLSCVAEQRVTEPVIGVAFDGTGLGTDGAIWGGELLFVDGLAFERLGHLSYVPLPGGDAAVRHPWRSAVAHLWAAYAGNLAHAPAAFLDRVDRAQLDLVVQTLTRPALAPLTSSVGRLFDAVAALLGLRLSAQFEAQAAMDLESLAEAAGPVRAYPVDVVESGTGWTIDSGSLVRAVVKDLVSGRRRREVAAAFHAGLADATAEVVARISAQTGVQRVALSGGVFQNATLTESLTQQLVRRGLDVLVHRRVPCNDAGLSLGQAYAAVLHTAPSRRPCV